jgi:hypothetical protein
MPYSPYHTPTRSFAFSKAIFAWSIPPFGKGRMGGFLRTAVPPNLSSIALKIAATTSSNLSYNVTSVKWALLRC